MKILAHRFWVSFWKKITNTNILTSVVSLVILIALTWGFDVPKEKIETTVTAVCAIGVLLGIFTKEGMDTTRWNDTLPTSKR